MEYLQSSFFVALLTRVWDFVTELFKGSVLYRFCMWGWQAFKSGYIYRFCTGGTLAAEIWRGSLAYSALSFLIDLPSRLVRTIYDRFKPYIEGSGFMKFALSLSTYLTPTLVGLFMLALLIIPQNRWDNMYSLLGAVAIFVVFLAAGARDRRYKLSLDEIGFFPALFTIFVAIAFISSLQMGLSLRFLVFGVTCALLVLLVVGATRSALDLERIVGLLSIGLMLSSLFAVYQRAARLVTENGILTDITIHEGMPGRVYSFFENPNSYANILVLFIPLMFMMALYARGGAKKLWYLAVFGVSCVALLMTYARGGWLSLVVGLGVLLLTVGPRWVPLCMLAVVAAIPLLPDSILNRLLSIFNSNDSSIYTRAYIYSAMGRLVTRYPIFGVGLGAAALKHAVEATGVYEAEALFIHAHNIYLQIWGEMGIFALFAFLLSMAFAIRSGLKLKTAENPTVRAVAVGAACGLCASLFFGITDYAWSYPRVMVIFWFVFALIPAAVRANNSKEVGIVNG